MNVIYALPEVSKEEIVLEILYGLANYDKINKYYYLDKSIINENRHQITEKKIISLDDTISFLLKNQYISVIKTPLEKNIYTFKYKIKDYTPFNLFGNKNFTKENIQLLNFNHIKFLIILLKIYINNSFKEFTLPKELIDDYILKTTNSNSEFIQHLTVTQIFPSYIEHFCKLIPITLLRTNYFNEMYTADFYKIEKINFNFPEPKLQPKPIKKIQKTKNIKKHKIKSKGEQTIKEILDEHKILYKREYTFPDCKDKGLLRFDFAIFNKDNTLSHLIEYNGEQHYLKEPKGYFTEENINGIKKRDKIKIQYCKNNFIPLIIIPNTCENINITTLTNILNNNYIKEEP